MLLAATAAKDLDAIRGPDLRRLRLRILSLEADPRPFGVKKLDGPSTASAAAIGASFIR